MSSPPIDPLTTSSYTEEPPVTSPNEEPQQATPSPLPEPQPQVKKTHPTTSRYIGDPERRPLLSPDDPSVSPLNVQNVKISKLILNISAVLSTFWLFLLLISDFVSIPGFNNRGRSFLEINLVLVSLISALSSLLFFQIPSTLERTLGLVSSGILALILLLLVSFQSRSIGVIGSLAAVWALFTNLFTSFAEYLVERGKEQEEVRLTGRVETRRTLSQWFVVGFKTVIKGILIAYISLVGLNILLHTFDILRVKPWGDLVPVEDDSFSLHIACFGDVYNTTDTSSQPILLLESGHGSSEEFSEWVEELHHLNQVERYCIYDRPGYGFSDSSPSPVSLSIISDILSEALRKKKIHGPFILVGHGIGGLYSRVFASRNAAQIKSIIFVDAWHEDLLLRNPNQNTKKDIPLPSEISSMNSRQGFKLWIKGLFSPLGLGLQASWIIKHRGPKDRLYGRDLHLQGTYLRARLQEQISASILSHNEVINSKESLAEIPISIVSSDYLIKKSLNWGNWQRELTKLSTKTKEWKIVDSGHEVWKTPKGKEQLQDVLLRALEV